MIISFGRIPPADRNGRRRCKIIFFIGELVLLKSGFLNPDIRSCHMTPKDILIKQMQTRILLNECTYLNIHGSVITLRRGSVNPLVTETFILKL